MRVNTGKKKVMMCQVSTGQAGNSKNHPCSVCSLLQFYYVRCVTDGFIKGAVASQVD